MESFQGLDGWGSARESKVMEPRFFILFLFTMYMCISLSLGSGHLHTCRPRHQITFMPVRQIWQPVSGMADAVIALGWGLTGLYPDFHFLQDWANFWLTDLFWHEKHRSVIVFVDLCFILQKYRIQKYSVCKWHLYEWIFWRWILTQREGEWLLLAATTACYLIDVLVLERRRKIDSKEKLTNLISNWCQDKANSNPACSASYSLGLTKQQ